MLRMSLAARAGTAADPPPAWQASKISAMTSSEETPWDSIAGPMSIPAHTTWKLPAASLTRIDSQQ